MLTVAKIWEGIRDEGVNCGRPTCFIELGAGTPYVPEELAREMVSKTRCRCICIKGENTTQVGMGALVKALIGIGHEVEVESDGTVVTPGWAHQVSRWLVDYAEDTSFSYGALRGQDAVRFRVNTTEDLELLDRGLNTLRVFQGTKEVLLKPDVKTQLKMEVFERLKKLEKGRIYLKC